MIWMTASSTTEKAAFEPLLLYMPLLILSASETFSWHWTKVTRCSQQTFSWRLIEGFKVNWTFHFVQLLRSHMCKSTGPFIHSWLLLCLGTLITTSLPQVFDMDASVTCLQEKSLSSDLLLATDGLSPFGIFSQSNISSTIKNSGTFKSGYNLRKNFSLCTVQTEKIPLFPCQELIFFEHVKA